MLVSTKLGADSSRGCADSGSAIYFSRPTPTLPFANGSMPALDVGLHEHALGERCELALDVYDAHLVVDHLLVTHRAMKRQRKDDDTLPGSLQSLGD
jgi:hypothetical protein